MLSYWEKKNLVHYDLIVIGGGFVGLSTAIHYKESHPGRTVLVLERGVLPSGASTRNAGFACFGSLSEIGEDLEKYTDEEVFELVLKRRLGIKNSRLVFGDKAMDYRPLGGYDLIREAEMPYLEQIDRINALFRPFFGSDVFSLVPDLASFGFGKAVKVVVKNEFEGQLDPGKYLQCLWKRCGDLGIMIHTGAEVRRVDKDNCRVYVRAYYEEEIAFQSRLLALCSNAFTGQLQEGLDIHPGRGMIMVSKPVAPLPWQGTFHMDRGYVYFRDVDGRLLVGGGRNLAMEEETTTDRGINARIRKHLVDLTREVILPGRACEWEMEWSGTMAFGQEKKPIVRRLNQRVAIGARLGGMGVAM